MSPHEPIITIGFDDDARRFVRQELTAFNRQQSPELRPLYEPQRHAPKPIHVYARDASGAIVGGVYGELLWSWFAIDVVWVSESHRAKGLGGRLLQTAEDAARAEGAIAAMLDTMDFQARGFYEKKGYVLYGELKNYPLTHTKYLLVKRFA